MQFNQLSLKVIANSFASSTPYQTVTFQSGDYILGFDDRGGFQLGKVEQAALRQGDELQGRRFF